MNRDESLTREIACLPSLLYTDSGYALYPGERSGGTWIGGNDRGLCAALINWYSVDRGKAPAFASRGSIIPAILRAASGETMEAILRRLDLAGTLPFRLLVFHSMKRRVAELRWDRKALRKIAYPWEARNWFSSGFDETEAQRVRELTCRSTRRTEGSIPRLRRLYASHEPYAGPFSICMHRPGAATVSYTEVTVGAEAMEMRYHAGPLCRCPESTSIRKLPFVCKERATKATNLVSGEIYENQEIPF